MDENLERWITQADEAERIDAVLSFEGSVDEADVEDLLGIEGITISELTESGDALVSLTPAGLRSIMNEDRVASIVESPRGPSYVDQPTAAGLVEPPPGTGDPGNPGKPLKD